MNENFNLNKLLAHTVEKQIQDNDPPVTKETYDRLITSGYDKATVMEMIISVVAEEIYHIMHEERPFDEKIYSDKLAKLK